MTFSFELIWAVLLLAPGLAAHAALFAGRDGAVIRATPPAPNSFGTIGIVVGAAAALHLVWATLAIALAQPCRIGFCPAAFAIDPDPYALAIALVAKAHPLTAHALVYLMAQAATLTIVGFVGVRRAMHTAWVRDRTRGFLYGHLAGLAAEIEHPSPRVIGAFVLTRIAADSLTVGYEGVIASLALGSGKTIEALTLLDAEKFVVRLGAGSFNRAPAGFAAPIARIVIERAQIENIAFNIYNT